MSKPFGEETEFQGSLAGFEKEMKALILETVNRGWRGRLSSNGHAILSHPNGLTVAVSRSARQYQPAKASILRVEDSTSTARFVFEGGEYVCTICGFHNPNKSKVAGHFVGNHVDRQKITTAKAKVKAEKSSAKNGGPVLKEENPTVKEDDEEMTPSIPNFKKMPIVETAGTELIESAEVLVQWLAEIPTASIKTIVDMVNVNAHLKEENKKLRDTLNALIALAREI